MGVKHGGQVSQWPLAPLLYISMLPRHFPCYLNLCNWTWSTHFTCKPLKILMTCQAIWNILKYVLLDICKIRNIPSWILRCEPKQTYMRKLHQVFLLLEKALIFIKLVLQLVLVSEFESMLNHTISQSQFSACNAWGMPIDFFLCVTYMNSWPIPWKTLMTFMQCQMSTRSLWIFFIEE